MLNLKENYMKKMRKKNEGFSLVELMVVVAIIGILAALAVPRFQTFQAKARQSEGKTNLNHIYTLQASYHGDNDTYGRLGQSDATTCAHINNDIGFNLTDCNKVRYRYSVTANAATTFGAQAIADKVGKKVNPSCDTRNDTWTITELKVLTNTLNAANCD